MKLYLLLLPLIAACVVESTEDYGPHEAEVGTEWDLGEGLVVTGFDHAEIVYYESAEGYCERPHQLFLGHVEEQEGPRLDFSIEFTGALPGEFAYDDLFPGIWNAEPSTDEHDITLVDGEQIMPLTAGTGRIDVNKTGWVQITLDGLIFSDKAGVYGGAAAFDLSVYCNRLTRWPSETEDGLGLGDGLGDCAWAADDVAAKTEFCHEMTAGYSPDMVHWTH